MLEHIHTGIKTSIMLTEKAALLGMEHPWLKLEPKYGKVWVLVESAFDLQNLLSLGFTWKLEEGYSYAAVEDPILGCDISWKFAKEFTEHGWEKIILGSLHDEEKAV